MAFQAPCRFCDSYRRAIHHIVSPGSLPAYMPPTVRDPDPAYSYLVTKSSQSCAGWFGGYGWALVSSVREHFLEKLETSSMWYCYRRFRLLTGLASAFKYCCRSRGEKLERTNITYGCLAKVVRDGGFTIALVARFSAIPGHCMSFRLFLAHRLTVCSYHRGVQHMRDGHHRIFPCGFILPP